jgi:O-antigen/teichoic acid export membrane protein
MFEIVGCWYLTAWFGVFGAALIRCLYVIALFVASLVRLRQLDIKRVAPKGRTVLRITVASVVAGLLLRFIGFGGLAELAVWGTVSLGVYLLLLLVFREPNTLDFRVARSIMPSRLHPAIEWLENRIIS